MKRLKGKEEDYEIVEKREWTIENISRYHENCANWESKEESVEKIWQEIKKKVQEAVPTTQRKRYKWRIGLKPWHDQQWKERKRGIRKVSR